MTATTESEYPAVAQECWANLNVLLDSCARNFAELPAIGMALEAPLSYRDFHARIAILAALLAAEGISHGDRVAFLAENSQNWGAAYFAVVRLGAVAVPILPDLPESDVHHILGEMKCLFIFTSQRQIEKVYDLKAQLQKIITLDDYREDSGVVDVQPFADFLQEAEIRFGEQYRADRLVFPEVGGHDLASILYTSGTSGFSKAVMLTHGNLCANGYAVSRIMNIKPGSTFLSVLPVSHTYEFTVGFLLPLIKGGRIVYAGKTPTPAVLQRICAAERPHAMLVVPLIMEKIYKKKVLPAIEKSRLLGFACRFRLGRRLIYRRIGAKLLEFFGGRLEVMGIGGASLNPEVEAFLREAGFPYIIGYGLTETAPLLAAGPHGDPAIPLGSTGMAIPGVELRLADPDPETGIGEILARGPNIMKGYWNDEEATAEALTADGWLRTGDMGSIDPRGYLFIKGRCKSVIVMASGENVYPEAIENKLNAFPFVVESVVLEKSGALEAWIYPDYEFIDEETAGQNRQQRHRYVTGKFDFLRREVNKQLSVNSRLSRIVERREPFVKTATHKIKRYLYSADTRDL
ncbi:Long-chain-fatty-acid--CoA ligase [hydrothermal vent metagenome]|uniref:Long-chain-fatty-acid--CoA ligase n=1 Tax=hydrothermal vent metagenome TaxID=652676 RepID=A0A3B0VSZ3_9ZZZZ